MTLDLVTAADKIFTLDEGLGAPGKPGQPYRDQFGYWTIGKGHLIGNSLTELKLSSFMINALFKEDLNIAIADAILALGEGAFSALNMPRQMAVISLTFSLGRRKFLAFERTIAAIKAQDFGAAAEHVLASKWARDVDPSQIPGKGRDDRVAYMLKTGKFHPDYGLLP